MTNNNLFIKDLQSRPGTVSPLMTDKPCKTIPEVLNQLQKLQDQREKLAAINLENVKSEDVRLRSNPRHKARLERKQAQAEEYFARKEAEEEGIDYERLQALNWTAEEVSAWQAKEEERKSRIDQGFTDYNQLAFKKYNRMVSSINPDIIKNLDPESEEAKSNLSADVQKQIQIRSQFSKRRHFSGDEEITYINQRNYKFNQKIARAYDKYTQETKDSLERGTAL